MDENTVVALFEAFEDARSALGDLLDIGIPAGRISFLANNTGGNHPPPITNPVFAIPEPVPDAPAISDLGVGIGVGAGIGGVFGMLIEVSSLAIPGIGPVIAAGPWVSFFAAIGGAAGAAIAALTDQGISRKDAELYAEGVRRGGTLLSVKAAKDQVHDVLRLLNSRHAVNVGQREASWRAEGWVGFDQSARPFSPSEMTALREREAETDQTARHHRKARRYFNPAATHERFAGVSSETTHFAEDLLKPH